MSDVISTCHYHARRNDADAGMTGNTSVVFYIININIYFKIILLNLKKPDDINLKTPLHNNSIKHGRIKL